LVKLKMVTAAILDFGFGQSQSPMKVFVCNLVQTNVGHVRIKDSILLAKLKIEEVKFQKYYCLSLLSEKQHRQLLKNSV